MNIPGTVGGAVKMNANAYGGDLSRVLEWVDVIARPDGTERRRPSRPRLPYRRSNLRPREVVARRGVRASSRPTRPGVKATLADMRAAAPRGAAVRHQDVRVHIQEPRRPARRGPHRRRTARRRGCRGCVGGARFSEKHANFVENTGEASTADVVALMAEGRRRVHERFGVVLEPEVQLLGDVDVSARQRMSATAASRGTRSAT